MRSSREIAIPAIRELADAVCDEKKPVVDGLVLTRVLGQGRSTIAFSGHPIGMDNIDDAVLFPSDSDGIDHFAAKIRAHAVLGRTSSTVELHGRGVYRTWPYIVEERGTPLSDLLRLDEASASYPRLGDFFNIGRHLFAALHYLHYLGRTNRAAAGRLGIAHIVHGDITPENILCFGNAYKLSDVACGGGAVSSSGLGSAMLSETGTMDYCAPEVMDGGQPTRASDVFSLGVVLYQVLTGAFPDPEQLYLPEKPRFLSVFFTRVLDKNPEHRFNALNAHALLEQIWNYHQS